LPRISLPVVGTPSRTELGQRCHRRHVLSDILQQRIYISPSAAFGTVIHSGVAQHWNSANQRDVLEIVRSTWREQFHRPNVNAEGHPEELALAIIEGYAKTATLAGPFGLVGPWQLVSVEQRLEIPVGRFVLSFQTDRVLYNKELDRILVIDTKTAGRLDARWRRQWELSLQMKLYKYGTSIAYDRENVDVVIEGVLKDVPTKIEYVTTPEWDSATLAEAVNQFEQMAARDEALILKCTHNGVVDLDELTERALVLTEFNYQDCYSYNVECPYRRLCVASPGERLAILRSDYFENSEELY